MENRTRIGSAFLLLLTATIWGVSFVAQSVGMEFAGPFTFNAIRCLLGGLVLIPCIFLLERFPKDEQQKSEVSQNTAAEQRENLMKGGVLCGLLLAAATNLQQTGIQYTTVGRAGFITAFYIVIVPFLGVVFLHKKYRYGIWIAVILALAGLYLLCITEKFEIGTGEVYILVSSLVFSLHMLVIDHYSPKVSGVKMSCVQFFVSGLVSAVPAAFTETINVPMLIQGWQPILYAGILACGVAYTLQIIGQKHVNPTTASLILSTESCISVLAGWVILRQSLTLREAAGCALMLVAVILAQLPERKA